MNDEKTLHLRVFKRSRKYMVLLWDRIEGANPNDTKITFRETDGPETIEAHHFTIDEPLKVPHELGDMNVSDDTVICVLEEEKNGIDPLRSYYVKVKYGGQEQGQRLMPAGVFPNHEGEDKKKNLHLYAWDDKSDRWRKVSGVRGKKGEFFLGVVCASCRDKQDGGDED